MVINIIDDETIEVFGATRQEAFQNVKELIRFIGNDRWRSVDGMLYRSCDHGCPTRCMNRVKFSKASKDSEKQATHFISG